MPTGPSKRHLGYDLADPHTVFLNETSSADLAAARAVETVLAEGEVLYVPSYWTHHIVSLYGFDDDPDPFINFQANTRSGTSSMTFPDKKAIEACLAGRRSDASFSSSAPRVSSSSSTDTLPQANEVPRWWESESSWQASIEKSGLAQLEGMVARLRAELDEQRLRTTRGKVN